MFIFQVHHYIQPEHVEEYLETTLANARETLKEPGVVRFDVFRDVEDPTHFSLLEIYQDKAAQEAHLETAHFEVWKEMYFRTRQRVGEGHQFEMHFPEEA
jgi:quinol monooxygenase YgiN